MKGHVGIQCVSLFFVSGLCCCLLSASHAAPAAGGDLASSVRPLPAAAAQNAGEDPDGGAVCQSYSHPAFTQVDLYRDFADYAAPDSTVTLPELSADLDCPTANVVGVVLDALDDTPIPNASIYANDTLLVTSGADGRFQITNLPDGVYDWKITSDAYETARYLNYTVDGLDGANIFTFYLERDREVTVDHNDFFIPERSIPFP